MRHPTADEIVAAFRDVTPEVAALMCELCDAADDSDKLPEVIERAVPELESDARYRFQLDTCEKRYFLVLRALDKLLGTHGVEFIPHEHSHEAWPYLNTGHYEAPTFVLENDSLLITSWLDVVEQREAEASHTEGT